jgi:hypothetical protein
MEDIVERLRNWRNVHLAHGGQLFEAAADEIERLRGDAAVARLRLDAAHAEIERLRLAIRRLADQDATLSVCDGAVTVTLDATLTDEERAAIEDAAGICEEHAEEYDGTNSSPIADTLRALLARLPK